MVCAVLQQWSVSSFLASQFNDKGVGYDSRSSSALAACVVLAVSIGNAKLVPGILKYFPGKWETRSADGTVLGDGV